MRHISLLFTGTGAKLSGKLKRWLHDYSKSWVPTGAPLAIIQRFSTAGISRNVRLGPFSCVEGAMSLNEGSVNSCKEDPVFIGPGVIMEHFIVCSGSIVTESTLIDKCFIGQGCVLGKHYSAENSLFFANCGGYHGEACSIFAGPYTVTHHKSTLAHRRDLFIYECRQRIEPEQSYVQAGSYSPGNYGERFKDNKRFISSMAGTNRTIYTCNGTSL